VEAPALSADECDEYLNYAYPEPRRSFSSLRILILILLIVLPTWYLFHRDANEKAAQTRKDQEFDRKRNREDESRNITGFH
jgi:hypothetical protein